MSPTSTYSQTSPLVLYDIVLFIASVSPIIRQTTHSSHYSDKKGFDQMESLTNVYQSLTKMVIEIEYLCFKTCIHEKERRFVLIKRTESNFNNTNNKINLHEIITSDI